MPEPTHQSRNHLGLEKKKWDILLLGISTMLPFMLTGTDLVEYLTGSPFIDEITVGGWKLDADGMLAIPDKPGLGLELDPDAIKKYTGVDNLL